VSGRLSKDELLNLYNSGLSQVQIGLKIGIHHGTISKWMSRYGIAPGRGTNRNPNAGPNAGQWKGSSASYSAFHKRVKHIRGRPQRCDRCSSTTAKKYEWANLTGNYQDMNDYVRLCVSCHRFHDGHGRGPKNGRWKGGPPSFNCKQCDILFHRYPPVSGTPQFCSMKCSGLWHRNFNANAIR
jgi:hypothetical protein